MPSLLLSIQRIEQWIHLRNYCLENLLVWEIFLRLLFFKGKFISKQRNAIPAGIIKEDICLSPLFFKVALKGCCHCEAGQEVPRLADSGKNYR